MNYEPRVGLPPDVPEKSRNLTIARLRELGACGDQLTLAESLATDGVIEVTESLCAKYSTRFDWDWAARETLSKAAWAEYKHACAHAWAEYDRIRAPGLAEYKRIHAQARAEYGRTCAHAWARAYIGDTPHEPADTVKRGRRKYVRRSRHNGQRARAGGYRCEDGHGRREGEVYDPNRSI